MKAIQANPCSIRQLFQSTYLIPEYQRPYTWEEDNCSQLWDDLETFFDQFTGDENYFLGSIVIHKEPASGKKEQAGEKWVVIDGQQRLMTLSLLLRAFLETAGTFDALKKCLHIYDDVSGEQTDKTRVTSKVVEQDNTALHDILLGNNEDADPSSRFAKNYAQLKEHINKWRAKPNQHPDELNKLIACILDKVTILSIECGNQEDALTLFQVINDRGTPLGNVDIFKAKIYETLENDKKGNFIEQWNKLELHEWLFRVNMHIQRAKDEDKGKERQLRAYYNNHPKRQFFKDPETATTLVNDLKLLHGVHKWEWETEKPLIDNWWFVLTRFPNQYWMFPLYVYLHKYGRNNDKEGFTLAGEKVESFEKLMHEVARYCYVKQLRYNQVNSSLKRTIYEAYIAIAKDEDYLGTLAKGCEQDIDAVVSMIEKEGVPDGSTLHPVVYLLALLNPEQRNIKASFYDMGKGKHKGKPNVEHILPQNGYNNYDGWTEKQAKECLNTVGNLVLIDEGNNIRAGNKSFQRKQEKYRNHEVVEDVKALGDAAQYPKWHHEDWKKRDDAMRKRLIDFLSTPTKP